MVSLAYANLISRFLRPIIIDFIQGKKDVKLGLIIGLDVISEIWEKNDKFFQELPIEQIRIELILKKIKKKKFVKSFNTFGAAYSLYNDTTTDSYMTEPNSEIPKHILGNLNKTINAKFDFGINIGLTFNETMVDELLDDFIDTIHHESNHILEHYCRWRNNSKGMNVSLAFAGEKNYNIPKEIFKVWYEFLTFVYFSEPYEMRAMTQEMYNIIKRTPLENLKEHRYFKSTEMMENFDANVYFDVIVEKIKDYNPDYLVPILTNLYRWYMRDYRLLNTSLGFEPNKKILKSKQVLNLMERFEPKIKMGGKMLKRKFLKLYSISPDELS